MTRCRLETRGDQAARLSSTCDRRHRTAARPARGGAVGCRPTTVTGDATLRLRGHVH